MACGDWSTVTVYQIGWAADTEQNTTTMEDKLVDLGNHNELCHFFLTLWRQNDNRLILKITIIVDRPTSRLSKHVAQPKFNDKTFLFNSIWTKITKNAWNTLATLLSSCYDLQKTPGTLTSVFLFSAELIFSQYGSVFSPIFIVVRCFLCISISVDPVHTPKPQHPLSLFYTGRDKVTLCSTLYSSTGTWHSTHKHKHTQRHTQVRAQGSVYLSFHKASWEEWHHPFSFFANVHQRRQCGHRVKPPPANSSLSRIVCRDKDCIT